MIFNIQKCSIHDGHGLRTLVFFKGCPLRCKWCANPESQAYGPEIMETPSKCIGCMACTKVCPQGAITLQEKGPLIDRDKCINCFKCTDRCYAAAKEPIGEDYDIEELYRLIDRDREFYKINGGGVTFSGGEPLTHPKYLTKIAKLCHERGIDVNMESCGVGNYEEFKHALPYISHMFFDIKHINSQIHQEITGSGNELILENLKKIAKHDIKITIRTPIIPGLNDTVDNLAGIAEFLRGIPEIKEYELLAYHQFGAGKYAALGRDYSLAEVEPPSDEKMRELVQCVNDVFDGSDKICFYTKDNTKEIVKSEESALNLLAM